MHSYWHNRRDYIFQKNIAQSKNTKTVILKSKTISMAIAIIFNKYKSYLFWVLVCVSYIFTAIHSTGYFHYDEHYQIIEFAGYKMNISSSDELAWEFNVKVRSAIQVGLCYLILKALNNLSVIDPYIQILVLRLITCLFSVAVISFFVKKTIYLIDKNLRNFYWCFSLLSWYMPFLSARFSSEIWAGLFFLLAMSFLLDENKQTPWPKIGVLLGISFLFRFQIGILIFCIIVWLIMIRKVRFRELLNCLVPLLAIVQIGILIDLWFYQSYTLTFLNYVIMFISDTFLYPISLFGDSPWYTIIEYILYAPLLPFGFLLLLTLLVAFIKHRNKLIIWLVYVFIIFHMFIGHKELRFLFPIVYLLPFLVILVWSPVISSFLRIYQTQSLLNITANAIVVILFITNLTALILMMFMPADDGEKNVTNYISKRYEGAVHLVCYKSDDPFNVLYPLKEKFYLNKKVSAHKVENLEDASSLIKNDTNTYLIFAHRENNSDIKMLSSKGFELLEVFHSIPKLLVRLLSFFGYKIDSYLLYEIKIRNDHVKSIGVKEEYIKWKIAPPSSENK